MSSAACTLIAKLRSSVLGTFSGTGKAVEDVIVSMIPQATSVVTGFLASVLVARGLGPKGMGTYALILSVSGLAGALSDLGIGQTAIRFASRAVEQQDSAQQMAILRWAFRLRILLVCLTSGVAFLVTPVVARELWHDVTLTGLVRISLLTSIFTAVAAVPTIYFQSLKHFRMNAAVSVGQTLVSFIGIILIATLHDWTLENVILVSVVSTGLGAITFAALVPRDSLFDLKDFRKKDSSWIARLLEAPAHSPNATPSLDSTGASSFAFFMLLSSIVVTVVMRADIWLMGIYLDKSQIGLYSVASRFTLPLVIILGALNTALWPRASAITTLAKARVIIGKTFRISLLVSLAGICYSVVVPFCTPYVFGPKYAAAVVLGQVLCVRYCLAILTCPIGVIGYSLGLVRVYWWINLLQLVAVVVVSILLLPRIGTMGSAVALIVNEVIGFCICGGIIYRRINALNPADGSE